MMRQMVFDGARRLHVDDAEPRSLAAGHARIEVAAAGVCGSDVHGFAGLNDRRPAGVVMGHEVGGRVVAVAPDAQPVVRVGDLVVVNPVVSCGDCRNCRSEMENICERRELYGCALELQGGFADCMDVWVANLVRFSDQVPREWSALVEPLAVGAHAVRRAGAQAGGTAVVVGAGPIGLACALAARNAGVAVTISEPLEERRGVAVQLGFTALAPDELEADSAPLVFECVGLAQTVAAAVSLAPPGGVVVCVGVADRMLPIPSAALVVEERSLVGSSAYTRGDFAATARWVGGGAVDLGPMITERRGILELPAAFEALASGAASAGKTVMVPS